MSNPSPPYEQENPATLVVTSGNEGGAAQAQGNVTGMSDSTETPSGVDQTTAEQKPLHPTTSDKIHAAIDKMRRRKSTSPTESDAGNKSTLKSPHESGSKAAQKSPSSSAVTFDSATKQSTGQDLQGADAKDRETRSGKSSFDGVRRRLSTVIKRRSDGEKIEGNKTPPVKEEESASGDAASVPAAAVTPATLVTPTAALDDNESKKRDTAGVKGDKGGFVSIVKTMFTPRPDLPRSTSISTPSSSHPANKKEEVSAAKTTESAGPTIPVRAASTSTPVKAGDTKENKVPTKTFQELKERVAEGFSKLTKDPKDSITTASVKTEQDSSKTIATPGIASEENPSGTAGVKTEHNSSPTQELCIKDGSVIEPPANASEEARSAFVTPGPVIPAQIPPLEPSTTTPPTSEAKEAEKSPKKLKERITAGWNEAKAFVSKDKDTLKDSAVTNTTGLNSSKPLPNATDFHSSPGTADVTASAGSPLAEQTADVFGGTSTGPVIAQELTAPPAHTGASPVRTTELEGQNANRSTQQSAKDDLPESVNEQGNPAQVAREEGHANTQP